MNITSQDNQTHLDCNYQLIISPRQRLYLQGMATVNCLLSLLIIFGNTLVLVSVFTNIRLRTKCNFFLVSLAMADMMVGLVDIPFWIYVLFNGFLIPQIMTFIFTLFDVLLSVSSMMSLTALSVVRCYSVLKPFRFHAQRDSVYAVVAAVFPWSVAGLACVAMYYLNEINKDKSGSYMAVFYFLPLVIILPAYGIMFNEGFKLAKISYTQSAIKEDLRAAKTVGIIIFCFLFTWLPFFLFQILSAVSAECLDYEAFIWGIPSLKFLQHSHSALNPVIYGARNSEFRETFLRVLKRKCISRSNGTMGSPTYTRTVFYSKGSLAETR